MRLGGLRLDEAVHFTIRDLQYRDGMPVICIDRNGKTPAARREIPVTQRLQDLGLADLFELRRDQGKTLLFPQMAGGRPGSGSARFRKGFIRYCETHGIDASTLRCHDFPKALQVALLLQGHSREVIVAVMGHELHRSFVLFDDVLRNGVLDALERIGADFPGVASPF